MKRAFTLVETLISAMIMLIVLTAVVSSFLAFQGLFKTAMAEMELAIAGRQLREKLLFRAAPQIDGVTYAGILSGTSESSVVEGGSTPNIQMTCKGVKNSLSDVYPQSMRIMMWGSGDSKHLLNEHIPNKDAHAGWLWPGRISLANSSIADVVGYDSDTTDASGIYRIYLNLNLKSGVKNRDGSAIVRRERIAVPVLGRLQPFSSGGRY